MITFVVNLSKEPKKNTAFFIMLSPKRPEKQCAYHRRFSAYRRVMIYEERFCQDVESLKPGVLNKNCKINKYIFGKHISISIYPNSYAMGKRAGVDVVVVVTCALWPKVFAFGFIRLGLLF